MPGPPTPRSPPSAVKPRLCPVTCRTVPLSTVRHDTGHKPDPPLPCGTDKRVAAGACAPVKPASTAPEPAA